MDKDDRDFHISILTWLAVCVTGAGVWAVIIWTAWKFL